MDGRNILSSGVILSWNVANRLPPRRTRSQPEGEEHTPTSGKGPDNFHMGKIAPFPIFPDVF